MTTKETILKEVEDVLKDLKEDEEYDVDVSRLAFCLMQALQKHFAAVPAARVAALREEFVEISPSDHGWTEEDMGRGCSE